MFNLTNMAGYYKCAELKKKKKQQHKAAFFHLVSLLRDALQNSSEISETGCASNHSIFESTLDRGDLCSFIV